MGYGAGRADPPGPQSIDAKKTESVHMGEKELGGERNERQGGDGGRRRGGGREGGIEGGGRVRSKSNVWPWWGGVWEGSEVSGGAADEGDGGGEGSNGHVDLGPAQGFRGT